MPTTRPRHVLTETDDLAAALDDAALRWPEDAGNRRKLLLRLVEAGHETAVREQEERISRRLEAIERTSGAFTGLFGPDYLEELRKDWPE